MTVDVSGLVVPTGRKGELNTNTTGIIELLDGESSVSAILEIELYDTSESTAFTVVQASCLVKDDVIGNTPSSQTPLPTYLTTLDTSEGGNGVSDSGKVAKYDSLGGLNAQTVHALGGFSMLDLLGSYTYTLLGTGASASRVIYLPDASGHVALTSNSDGSIDAADIVGIPTYADETSANAAEDPNVVYWNTATSKVQITTA